MLCVMSASVWAQTFCIDVEIKNGLFGLKKKTFIGATCIHIEKDSIKFIQNSKVNSSEEILEYNYLSRQNARFDTLMTRNYQYTVMWHCDSIVALIRANNGKVSMYTTWEFYRMMRNAEIYKQN